jgi:dihydroceramidase
MKLTYLTVYFALRYPRKPSGTSKWPLDTLSVALFVLGVNSFLYHATLRQTTQFLDEVAGMNVLIFALLQGVYTVGQESGTSNVISALLLAIITGWSAVYIRTGDILHHVIPYNTMIVLVGLRTLYLMFLTRRSRDEKWRLSGMFAKALGVLVLAYTLWQIDLEKCFELRRIRAQLGLPWAWILELHGWWHILTALGASQYCRLIRELQVT